MPNSIIWIGLVVVWIFVLLPMLVKQRPPVRVTTEAALASRVVHRGDDPPSEQRRVATAVASRLRGAHPTARASADEEPEDRMHDDDSYRRESRSRSRDADDLYEEETDDADYREPAPRRSRPDGRDGFVSDRSGRGGYDPEADALARAARYAFRRRTVLGGGLVAVFAVILAIVVSPVFWWVSAVIAVALVGYLAYLRRQVRIEEDIRRRRLARMHRRYGDDEDEDDGPVRRTSVDDEYEDDLEDIEESDYEEPKYRKVEEVRRAPARKPAGRPVAVDEEDPSFDELDDVEEIAMPRARGA